MLIYKMLHLLHRVRIPYSKFSSPKTCRNIDKSRKETNRLKIAKNGYLYDFLLPWQQPAIYLYERKRNPRCVANLNCECQELTPKVETNRSHLVLRPSCVDTVNIIERVTLIVNKTSCRPFRSVIILVINKSDSRCAVVRFCYHSYDYRPN